MKTKEICIFILGVIAIMVKEGGSSSLRDADYVTAESLTEVAEKLLGGLGLEELPKHGKRVVPQHILDIYKSYSEAVDSGRLLDRYKWNMIWSFFSEDRADKGDYFYFLNIPNEEEIIDAELHFPIPQSAYEAMKIQVFDIQENELAEPLEERIINPSNVGWEVFNVTSTIKKWFGKTSIQNTGFKMRLLDSFGHELSSSNLQGQNEGVLIVYSKSPKVFGSRSHFQISERKAKTARKIRSIPKEISQPNSGHKGCQKQNFTISFSELGWSSFVVYPESFDTAYCAGTCGKIGESNTYTQVIDRAYELGKIDASAFSWCIPAKFIPLTLAYFDPDGLLRTTTVENMIVADCECL